MTEVTRAYYFGCRGRAGHYWWVEGRGEITPPDDQPWPAVDGRFTPQTRDQGAAALHHKEGWTLLAVWDYTIDSRPGSNVAFIFNAVLTFEEAVTAAREHFPRDLARVGEITEASSS